LSDALGHGTREKAVLTIIEAHPKPRKWRFEAVLQDETGDTSGEGMGLGKKVIEILM
jgi:hypothetical protein